MRPCLTFNPSLGGLGSLVLDTRDQLMRARDDRPLAGSAVRFLRLMGEDAAVDLRPGRPRGGA